MDDENFDIETGDAGASDTVSVEAGQIRKGGYIMIKVNLVKFEMYLFQKPGNMDMQNVNFPLLIYLQVILVKNCVLQHIL